MSVRLLYGIPILFSFFFFCVCVCVFEHFILFSLRATRTINFYTMLSYGYKHWGRNFQNENIRYVHASFVKQLQQRRQRKRHKTISLTSIITMVLCVFYVFWYILWPFCVKQQLRMTKFNVSWKTWKHERFSWQFSSWLLPKLGKSRLFCFPCHWEISFFWRVEFAVDLLHTVAS